MKLPALWIADFLDTIIFWKEIKFLSFLKNLIANLLLRDNEPLRNATSSGNTCIFEFFCIYASLTTQPKDLMKYLNKFIRFL
jgi:hypothetical protein